ncbi:MAG TPA: DUF5690 family protein [Flavihumibacter sp.]|nr:DUF5690 family protein [Flavihumibacter sp.]HPZ89176.1 DUF5690 family protein [Flavihumibacter sp.]HQD08272.1 DUF5690 family protein [Flavihumibacter sp.]
MYMAIVVFCLYSSLFCFRKAFNVAAFEGHTLFGISYKVVLVITQVLGYMASKFYGIGFIASLRRYNRGQLIFLLAGIALASWLLFALVPAPWGFWCLLFSGFPLALLWGIVFSYVEGRRMTDLISAALAVSFIFGAGLAKSVGKAVMSAGVSEQWMPFLTAAIFVLPIIICTRLADRFPAPDADDIAHRTERKPMSKSDRWQLMKQYGGGLILLIGVYILVTILREVRDSFMADMWRESGESFSASVFAQTETIITLALLLVIAAMVLVKDNWKAFSLTHLLLCVGFACCLLATLLYRQQNISTWWWMLLIGLGLYLVYIPFNSILFDRFIASFAIVGNVGFLIYLADSFGYLGSVTVMLVRNFSGSQIQWLEFFRSLLMVVGVVGLLLSAGSWWYFARKIRRFNSLSKKAA